MSQNSLEELIRHEFRLKPEIIHLNHAAVGPWPYRTSAAVKSFADENMQQGSLNYLEWLQVEKRLRERMARLIHAPSADDIALLKNTSEGLSLVANGLEWRSGDNVIISADEFPSNRIVWEALQSRGVTVKRIVIQDKDNPEQALIQAMDEDTRLLSISSVQYATGLRLDLKLLGEACSRHNILFCVDAIQSIGAIQMDVQAIQADFVVADGHKWMLGPEGLALFYTKPQAKEKLQLSQYGWHMIEDHHNFNTLTWEPAKNSRRFECGSPNMLGIYALDASLSLFEELGIAQIEKIILQKSRFLFEFLQDLPDIELITRDQPGRYAGIVTFRSNVEAAEALYQRLQAAGILCAPRGGGIRFSPHFYTDTRHLQKACELLIPTDIH